MTEKALEMAKIFNQFFQQPDVIGLVGGTIRKEGDARAISSIDQCAIRGECNRNRHPELGEIKIPAFEVVYPVNPEELSAHMRADLYISGGTIANPACRLAFHDVGPARLDAVTIKEMLAKPRVPVVFDMEPGINPELYGKNAEDFRIEGHRPNWIARIVDTSKKFYVPVSEKKDARCYAEIGRDKLEKYVTKQLVPIANADDWKVDYGFLGRIQNPVASDRDILFASGCHWLATLGPNTMLTYTTTMPEKSITVQGNTEALELLYNVLHDEKAKYFEAIVATTARHTKAGQDITNQITGVFVL